MNKWDGKRVLVTGSGGFIGSHLTERLVSEGASVRAFVRYNALGSAGWLDSSPSRDDLEIVYGDITDRDSVSAAVKGVDLVYHLCSLIAIPYSYAAPFSYLGTNVTGTFNVLQACRDVGVGRLVHTSSSEVYGSAQYTPMDERHPICPQSPYAGSKVAADALVAAFHRSYGVPAVTVRPFNTFGPRQSPRAIVPTIIGQCLAGNVVRLGNVQTVRDFNYVSNTVEGFLLAGLTQGIEGRVINLGSVRGVSIVELVTMISRQVGKVVDLECDVQRVRPELSEVTRLICDASLAQKLLGWQPRVMLAEGLARTIEWMRDSGAGKRACEYAV